MTRRKFIRKLINAVSAVIASLLSVIASPPSADEAISKPTVKRSRRTPHNDSGPMLDAPPLGSPRKFVRAVRLDTYPGPLRPLQNTSKQSKWSG